MSGRGALSVEGLSAAYGRARVLFDVSLNVGAGEAVALVGRNGAGKTTTMRAIMGLVRRLSGVVRLDGRDISALPTYAIARLGLGYAPEDRRIFSELTAEENLSVGRQPPRAGAPGWAPERIYQIFPTLRELRRHPGDRMSGGEQQMLAIARALMGNPKLIMLDEPSEGLAPRIVDEMSTAVIAMKSEGLGVLVSEQNLAFARRIVDRLYVIEKGNIRFSGAMDEFDRRPDVRDAYLAL